MADISKVFLGRAKDREKKFSLTAPSTPGLYMIWARATLHHGFRIAEETYPEDFLDSEEWYDGFIAWLRVDPSAAPMKPRTGATKVKLY